MDTLTLNVADGHTMHYYRWLPEVGTPGHRADRARHGRTCGPLRLDGRPSDRAPALPSTPRTIAGHGASSSPGSLRRHGRGRLEPDDQRRCGAHRNTSSRTNTLACPTRWSATAWAPCSPSSTCIASAASWMPPCSPVHPDSAARSSSGFPTPSPASKPGGTAFDAHSDLLQNLLFGKSNEPFDGPDATGFEWLSRDPAQVQRYVDDPACGFVLRAGSVANLMAGAREARKKSFIAGIPADLTHLRVCRPGGSGARRGERDLNRLLERYRKAQVESGGLPSLPGRPPRDAERNEPGRGRRRPGQAWLRQALL